MSEREYMKEALESKERIVICRWDRRTGKTEFICRKIANIIKEYREKENGKELINILVLTVGQSSIKYIKDMMERICKEELRELKDKEYLVFSDNKKGDVDFHYSLGDNKNIWVDIENSNYKKEAFEFLTYDYIFFNDVDLFWNRKEITKSSQLFLKDKYDGHLSYDLGIEQTFFLFSDEQNNFKFIDNSKEITFKNRKQYLNKILDDLLKEYCDLPKANNTVKTRNDLLQQINIVYSLLEKDK